MQNYSFLADDNAGRMFLSFICDLTLVRLVEFNFTDASFSGVVVITADQLFFEEHFNCLGAAFLKVITCVGTSPHL